MTFFLFSGIGNSLSSHEHQHPLDMRIQTSPIEPNRLQPPSENSPTCGFSHNMGGAPDIEMDPPSLFSEDSTPHGHTCGFQTENLRRLTLIQNENIEPAKQPEISRPAFLPNANINENRRFFTFHFLFAV